MNKDILNTVNQDFINFNLDSDVAKLLLQNLEFNNVLIKEIVEQIEAKKKCKIKLPTWFNAKNIYYPNKLNIEQTSSEATAQYKSQLISGTSLIDLTGGFGVDTYCFSKVFDSVTHCEINEHLSVIVNNNYKQLKAHNITLINDDGIKYIKSSKKTYDWIYIDPSRRHNTKGKVFFLKDCLPNVPEHLESLFKLSNNIMIKTAPLLDIKAGLRELDGVKKVHVVSVNNDVKELLWVLEKDYSDAIDITAINLKKDKDDIFSFKIENESDANATFSEPLAYLYEPNSAILKAGAFKLLSHKLKLHKLNVNSHLYTSNGLKNFPGRRFKVDKILSYNKKLLKKEFLYMKANISIRNFPETVEQLKKRFNLRDGGTIYMFFTTNVNNQKVVLVCSKV